MVGTWTWGLSLVVTLLASFQVAGTRLRAVNSFVRYGALVREELHSKDALRHLIESLAPALNVTKSKLCLERCLLLQWGE